jgi:hypothetical protein
MLLPGRFFSAPVAAPISIASARVYTQYKWACLAQRSRLLCSASPLLAYQYRASNYMSKMQGKLILVTGGNRGLGLEVCRKIVNAGGKVILTARNHAAGVDTTLPIVNFCFV